MRIDKELPEPLSLPNPLQIEREFLETPAWNAFFDSFPQSMSLDEKRQFMTGMINQMNHEFSRLFQRALKQIKKMREDEQSC